MDSYLNISQVLVHSPEEFPDVADRGFVVGLGSET